MIQSALAEIFLMLRNREIKICLIISAIIIVGGTVVAMGLLAVALALHIGSQLFLVRVFVPLELVAMGGYLLCGTLAFWMRRQWRKVQVTSYHTDERAQAAPHKAS